MAGSPSKSTSSFSRAGISFGVLVQSFCVIFLVVAANYIGFNYYKRWDFSRSQKFTLADQTEQVLRQLESLKVILYYSTGTLGPDAALYNDVQNLLEQFIFSARRKIELRQVDPAREVAAARELQEKYAFDGNQNTLILDYQGRRKLIPLVELGEFDFSGLEVGEGPKLIEFKGEAILTSALIELLNPKKVKVYFTQGHGETQPSKLALLNEYLSRQNVAVVGLNLGLVDQVPEDGSAVAIVGAHYDLTESEIEILRHYWAGQGRLVVLLDPDSMIHMPNLRKFLNEAGIYPRNDRVRRLARSVTQPDLVGFFPYVDGIFLPDSPITKRLVGATARLPGATQSIFLHVDYALKKDIQLRGLIQAIEEYWGESDYLDHTKLGLQYNDGRDAGEPLLIAVGAERGAAKDDRTDIARAHMVVVGNSAFVENEALRISPANLDFMVSVFNRMMEGRSKLTGIIPKSTMQFSLSLTEAQIRSIAFYTLIVIPGVAVLVGLIIGIRRRA